MTLKWKHWHNSMELRQESVFQQRLGCMCVRTAVMLLLHCSQKFGCKHELLVQTWTAFKVAQVLGMIQAQKSTALCTLQSHVEVTAGQVHVYWTCRETWLPLPCNQQDLSSSPFKVKLWTSSTAVLTGREKEPINQLMQLPAKQTPSPEGVYRNEWTLN